MFLYQMCSPFCERLEPVTLKGFAYFGISLDILPYLVDLIPSLKPTFSHLKMDGWTIDSYWVPAYFQGRLLLVLGRVYQGISQVVKGGR